MVHQELRRHATAYMRRERVGHTRHPTALVHEAYLRLVKQDAPWQSRAQFFGVAGQMMRRILVDRARARRMAKRSKTTGASNLRSSRAAAARLGREHRR